MSRPTDDDRIEALRRFLAGLERRRGCLPIPPASFVTPPMF
jgi:hypothetical protein